MCDPSKTAARLLTALNAAIDLISFSQAIRCIRPAWFESTSKADNLTIRVEGVVWPYVLLAHSKESIVRADSSTT